MQYIAPEARCREQARPEVADTYVQVEPAPPFPARLLLLLALLTGLAEAGISSVPLRTLHMQNVILALHLAHLDPAAPNVAARAVLPFVRAVEALLGVGSL